MCGSLRAARRGRQSETQSDWKLRAEIGVDPASKRLTAPPLTPALRRRPRLIIRPGPFLRSPRAISLRSLPVPTKALACYTASALPGDAHGQVALAKLVSAPSGRFSFAWPFFLPPNWRPYRAFALPKNSSRERIRKVFVGTGLARDFHPSCSIDGTESDWSLGEAE